MNEPHSRAKGFRAAGQAIPTTHVPKHSYGFAVHAQHAIGRVTNSLDADVAIAEERNWYYQHLLELSKKPT